MDQELYFAELQYIVALLKLLTKENETHEPPGVFSQAEFTQILNTFFSGNVDDAGMEALLAAVQVELDDSETTDIEFTRLFFEVGLYSFYPVHRTQNIVSSMIHFLNLVSNFCTACN